MAIRLTPLTESRWQRLQDLFLAAAELSPPDREHFVERETVGDPDLQRELTGMLARSADAGQLIASTIEVAALIAAPESMWIGRRIGAYRIRREIGRGGMGLVFEARRDDDEYRKTVALKIAPPWHDAARFDERFRLERQILAQLEHPNIARFLDGGTHNGLPYFVMELVEGEPITAFCDHHRLDIRARIALFRQVCAAVRFAHESLIVHRDLKPSNIFVTDDGTTKLLDFGIAKLLDPIGETNLTSTIAAAWTPDYTSPEQVRGRPVTTRTDVYSLGLILYELLTGARAQLADTSTPVALERSVCETTPPRPSACEAAAGRTAAARRLRGELDTIVMKAIQKEPERRYGSTAALSDDLGRYLDGRPIVARPGTAWYRSRKFLVRHQVGAAAAALVVVSLAAGVVSTLYEARRAQRRFDQVRTLANTFVFEVHDQIETLAGSTAARKTIVQTALTYLESLRQDAGGDPALTREIAAAYYKIGNVQGVPTRSNLGDTAGAVVSFTRAQELLEPLAAGGDQQAGAQLVSALTSLASVREAQGKIPDMLAAESKAREMGERLLGTRPTDETLLAQMAAVYETITSHAGRSGRFASAEAPARRAVEIRQHLLGIAPESRVYQDGLGGAYNALGQALHGELKLDEAVENIQSSVHIRERMVAEHPESAEYRHSLIVSYGTLGDVLAFQPGRNLADGPGAAAAFQKAVALADAARARDPQDRRTLYDLVNSKLRLGSVDANYVHDYNAALTELGDADRVNQQLLAEDPRNARYATTAAVIDGLTGETLAASGRNDAAVLRFDAALAVTGKMADTSAKQNQLTLLNLRLAEVKARQGDTDAVRLADLVERDLSTRPVTLPFNDALFRTDLGRLYAWMGSRSWPPGREPLTARAILRLEDGIPRWRAIALPAALEPRRAQEIATAEADLARLRALPARHGS